jgi:hypothetical protein
MRFKRGVAVAAGTGHAATAGGPETPASPPRRDPGAPAAAFPPRNPSPENGGRGRPRAEQAGTATSPSVSESISCRPYPPPRLATTPDAGRPGDTADSAGRGPNSCSVQVLLGRAAARESPLLPGRSAAPRPIPEVLLVRTLISRRVGPLPRAPARPAEGDAVPPCSHRPDTGLEGPVRVLPPAPGAVPGACNNAVTILLLRCSCAGGGFSSGVTSM